MSSNRTKITLLVDNGPFLESGTPPSGGVTNLATEHGLSMWIEHGDKRILLDTGQGPALEPNAAALGIDLSQTDILALSHGHYDHTGGVDRLLALAPTTQVYCHPSVTNDRYAVREGRSDFIGMPKSPLHALRHLQAGQINWVTGPTSLVNDVSLTGPVPRLTDYEDTGGPFYQDDAGWRPDPLEDDLALWIGTREGLVICFGCAHSGAVNTLDYVRTLAPHTPIRAIIGGLHLNSASEERLQRTAEALRALDIPDIVPCHCTGAKAAQTFAEALGERVRAGGPGTTMEF